MLNLNKKVLASAVCAALSQAVISGGALAQDSGEQGKLAIEEIVVTGTKRDVAQQDLAATVSTITAKQIENTFQNDVTALSELAPNVNLTPQNGFNAIAGGMRGTGFISILVTKDASVGITVDEFAYNHVQSQFVEMFDMEQVEIFRGPQGTLFGKNTTGGAIAFTTKKPVLGEFFGEVEGDYGQYSSNDSDFSKLKFSLNVPIGDTVAARLAVIQDKSDGYYTNDKPAGGEFQSLACPFPGQPGSEECNDASRSAFPDVGQGEDLGGKDVLAIKLKLKWQPNDFYTANFIYEYVKDEGDTVATSNETPSANQNGGEGYLWPIAGFPGIGNGNPFSTGQSYTSNAAVDIPGGHQIDAEGFYLNQTFSFDQYEVKWILGYREQDEVLASTYTGEAYTSLYDASRNSERESLQNELRISTQFDGPFNFVAGAAYYEDDVEFQVFGSLGFFLVFSGPAAEFYRDTFEVQYTKQERESTAFYLDGSYEITDKLQLSAGIRYSDDDKDFKRLSLGTAENPVSNFITLDQYRGPHTQVLPESAFGINIEDDESWSENTYRLVLDYRWNDNVMTYLSYGTGFVAGGFSETCGSITACAPYEQEENTNLEVGLKADLLDGSLRFNAALFHTEYENLQRDTVVAFKDAAGNDFQETRAINEGESTAEGLELEVTYLPTENFRVDLNIGWLDHSYDSYDPTFNTADLGLDGGVRPVDLSSLEVPFSPELNWGLGFTYFQDLSSGSSITYNINAHYQDEFETSPAPASGLGGTVENPILRQKANTQAEERTLVNAYVTWESDSGFKASLYGKNLTDELYRVSANPVANLWNFTRHGAPRQVGIQLGYSF
ncbi:MAG: iron complex outermembrane receptor protein [Halioglobus sp.]|jgi:iron complex outermembrane receptor protein